MKNNKGITLIALVITIILMLILVTVVIGQVQNGKLFSHAENALQRTKTAMEGENEIPNKDTEIIETVSDQTGTGNNPYANENFAKAWTYTNGGSWSGDITNNSTPLTGDIVAKLYEKDSGYHLVIEKIGENGNMGDLSVVTSKGDNKRIAKRTLIADDMSKNLIIGWAEASYAWETGNYESSIKKVFIGDGITSIGRRAFQGCTNLNSIEIPNTVTVIKEYAFTQCSSLQTITFAGTTEEWNAIQKSDDYEFTISCTDGDCAYTRIILDPLPGGIIKR